MPELEKIFSIHEGGIVRVAPVDGGPGRHLTVLNIGSAISLAIGDETFKVPVEDVIRSGMVHVPREGICIVMGTKPPPQRKR